jgi:hypothetical protein
MGPGSHSLGLLPLCLSAALLASLASSGSSNPPVLPGSGSRSVLAQGALIGGQLRLRGGDARETRGGYGGYRGGGGGGGGGGWSKNSGSRKEKPTITIHVRQPSHVDTGEVTGR